MTVISSKKLCREENLDVFFNKLKDGKVVAREYQVNGEKRKEVVTTNHKIFFDDFHSVRFYLHEGYWHLALDIKSLEDRKRIKEYRESTKDLDRGDDL